MLNPFIGSDAAPAHLTGPNEFSDQGGVDGILAMGWGSGSALFLCFDPTASDVAFSTANFTYLFSVSYAPYHLSCLLIVLHAAV